MWAPLYQLLFRGRHACVCIARNRTRLHRISPRGLSGRSPGLHASNTIPPYREQVKRDYQPLSRRRAPSGPTAVRAWRLYGRMGMGRAFPAILFARHGFAAHAVSLRGHGRSEGRDRLHGSGLDDFVSDVDTAVAQIGVLPVLIGHSLDGFLESLAGTPLSIGAGRPMGSRRPPCVWWTDGCNGGPPKPLYR